MAPVAHPAPRAPKAALVATPSSEQRISASSTTDPRSESDIRINPSQPQQIIAAANSINSGLQAQLYSTDGGSTWGQTSLPLQSQLGDAKQADPLVEWTADGEAWAATLGINATGTAVQIEGFRSLDSGASWSFNGLISGSQTAADKPILWVDHSTNVADPYKDALYAVWSYFNSQFTAQIYVNRRAGPAGTWSTPLLLSGAETSATGTGSDIKTNAYGEVFAFWHDSGTRNIYFVKSTNSGLSYSSPVALVQTIGQQKIIIPAFSYRWPLIYVSAAAYRTATKNLVYASWMDLNGGSGCDDSFYQPGTDVTSICKTRIWFTRSQDGGASWSPPAMINNQVSKNDQFAEHLVVDDTTGQLAIIYYDTVGNPGRLKTDVWYQASFDDGSTWAVPFKVTSQPTDETVAGADSANMYGDYNGLAVHAGTFRPSWTDRRSSGREEIWSTVLFDSCGDPLGPGCSALVSWVSASGNDSDNCSRGTPCRTFAGALARISPGGEIDVLDSGDFGPLTINKAVSLVASGPLGGIRVTSGNAITISAGANDRIVLRGLSLDGTGTGASGISFTSGGSLYVENCTVNGFSAYGIDFEPASGSGKLFVTDTVIRNNGIGATGGGVYLLATTGPGFIAAVDRLRSVNNVAGLKAEGLGSVTLRNSLAANNGFSGFSATSTSGGVRMLIEDSLSTHNGTNGILSSGTATVTLSNVVVTDNQTGLNNAGTILSFGNNKVQGNTTNGTPTQTILSH